jgi:hypothetical protein
LIGASPATSISNILFAVDAGQVSRVLLSEIDWRDLGPRHPVSGCARDLALLRPFGSMVLLASLGAAGRLSAVSFFSHLCINMHVPSRDF